jgi:hypothetical protein
VICADGGGIPTIYRPGRQLVGVEAVTDKDLASALLARDIGADILIMATDAQAVFVGFGTPQQRAIVAADPDVLLAEHEAEFAAGSMLPQGAGRVRLREDDRKARGDRCAGRHRRHARRRRGHPRRGRRTLGMKRWPWDAGTLKVKVNGGQATSSAPRATVNGDSGVLPSARRRGSLRFRP